MRRHERAKRAQRTKRAEVERGHISFISFVLKGKVLIVVSVVRPAY